jgi:hypothetical protein
MTATRAEIVAEIDRLISLLDQMDGDADYEIELPEEQHDAEADLTWHNGHAPEWFVIAEKERKKSIKIN